MSLYPKVLVSRHEIVRGISRALAIGAIAAAASIGLSADAVEAQAKGGREYQRVAQQLSVAIPEAIILREQHVIAERVVDGMLERDIAVRVGGNVAIRLEVAPLGAESVGARVQDASGAWVELDRVVEVARVERGAMHDLQVKVRVPLGQDAQPLLRAVRAY